MNEKRPGGQQSKQQALVLGASTSASITKFISVGITARKSIPFSQIWCFREVGL